MTDLECFKATVRKKLNHSETEEAEHNSSPDSSPIRFTRVCRIAPIINLDSDDDGDSDDCVIVSTDAAPPETPVLNGETESDLRIASVRSVTENDSANDVSAVQDDDDEPTRKRKIEESSSNEAHRPTKRKKVRTKKRKIKGRMSVNEETQDNSGGDDEAEASFTKEEYFDSEEETDTVHKDIRKQVIEFLNSSTSQEFLLSVPTMREKIIETVISCRPFLSWADVNFKFRNIKGLRSSILETVCNVFVAKEIVKGVLLKCEKLAAKTKKRVFTVGTLVSESPKLLNPELSLSQYQLIGLNWLALMRSESLNSILADEMGLGKTIQVIAFLAYLKENDLAMAGYPHLIVVPASTLNNWANELARWCPSLKVQQYYGDQSERRYMRHLWFKKDGFGDIDVILTTYSCASQMPEEKKMFKVKEFNYIIFDEAHMLKNMSTKRYEALIHFNGNFKILLTGTPLQNNLLELMSLLNFLMPTLFHGETNHLKFLFSKCNKSINSDSSDYEKATVEQAKKIIEPFMLRRTKETVLRDLPPKTVIVEKCSLTNYQRIKYEEIADVFKETVKLGETTNCHMSYFMMFRKIANHPLLLRFQFSEDMLREISTRLAGDKSYKGTNADYILDDLYSKSDFELHCMCEDMESLQTLNFKIEDELFLQSGKLEKLTPMLKSLKENGHRVLIFSQFIEMLDILQEFCRIKDYTYLRLDGSTQTADRQDLIDTFNADESIFIFLLSTKAGGLGINLTSADTVIIHDIDYNPYNDKQAEDRCHRIGQTRPVTVYRLVGELTVEEHMQTAATKKLYLEREVTSSTDDDDQKVKVAQLLKESLGL